MTMEIERKFRITEENPFKNLKNGESFVRKGEIYFLDEYFDSRSYVLSMNDYWLRRRSLDSSAAKWELKFHDVESGEAVTGNHCARYSELSDPPRIAARIGTLLGQTEGVTLEELLDTNLECWCAIQTSRQIYELSVTEYEHSLTVVLDSTENEAIGEVEIVLPEIHSSGDIRRAEKAINDVFARFGLQNATEGKVERFIREQRPELFEKIKHKLKQR